MLPVIARNIAELRRVIPAGQQVALTPTMGALHEGHLSLARRGRELADINIVSIYVNPLQFGPQEDFSSYPRDLEADCAQLLGIADIVYAPDNTEIYPSAQTVTISLPPLANELCGRSRPGFFQGVTTVVCKLFNSVRPQVAIFGKKDFQQLHLVRLMTAQLNFPITIVAIPIVRETDGLAMSSRNAYLSVEERRQATLLSESLRTAAAAISAGGDWETATLAITQQLTANGFAVDYVECRDAATLSKPTSNNNVVLLAAATLGRTRLIDNMEVCLTSA